MLDYPVPVSGNTLYSSIAFYPVSVGGVLVAVLLQAFLVLLLAPLYRIIFLVNKISIQYKDYKVFYYP